MININFYKMRHPTGFFDAHNFVIKENGVYNNSPGNSYLNKFVSGLKLEEKFQNDDFDEFLKKCREPKNITEPINATIEIKKMINYDFENYDFEKKHNVVCDSRRNKKGNQRQTKEKLRESKEKQSKKKGNKLKKNRLARNDAKMFYINQYITKPTQLLDKKEIEIENWYLEYLNIDLVDHSDDCRISYDSDEEFEERQLECQIEYARYMCSL